MRKTVLLFVVFLTVCVSMGISACAENGAITLLEGSQTVLPGNYYEDIVLVDDTLFVRDYNQQEVIAIDMLSFEERSRFSAIQEINDSGETKYNEVRSLLRLEDKLHAVIMTYRLDAEDHRVFDDIGIYAVGVTEDTLHCDKVIDLDFKEYVYFERGWGEELPEIRDIVQMNEWFYMLASTSEGVQLLRVSTDIGGVPEKMDAPAWISDILCADGGKLLIVLNDGQGQSIGLYDPGTAAYAEEMRLSTAASGFATDLKHLYWNENGRIYRAGLDESGAGSELVGSVPMIDAYYGVLVGTEAYIAASNTKVMRAPLEDRQITPITLNVCGSVSDAWILAFMEEHPNVTIQYEFLENDTIIDHMLTQSGAFDIMILDSEESCYETLLNRGYLKQLDSSALSDFVNSTYEYIQDACKKDGEQYAIPVRWQTQQYLLAANLEAVRELSFDIPTSWEEMLNLAENWSSNPLSEEICLFQSESPDAVRVALLQHLLLNYHVRREGNGDNVKFADESFLRLIQQAMNLPSAAEGDKLCTTKAEHALFQFNQGVTINAGDARIVTPLSIYTGEAPVLGCNVQFACVNPYSVHIAEAMEFLETMAANLEAEDYASMVPTRNEPIVAEWYPSMVKQSEDEMAALREKIEAANEIDRAELKKELASLEAFWVKTLSEYQYAATEESIRAFREYGEAFVIARPSVFSTGGSQLTTNTERFMVGSLPVEEYLSFLDEQIAMNSLEGS